jgi:aminopeptidase YwaD
MKKVILKILSFLILTLFICPLIMADKITQKKQTIDNIRLEAKGINPKILEIVNKINETLIRNFLEYLVFEIGCRYTGSYGCQKAAKYIHSQFKNMGLQVRYQNWSSRGNIWHNRFFISQNIEATQKGVDKSRDEVIIFNAHYDTVKGTVGANDDGSGTVGVLATAYVLSQYTFGRTIKFVSFSGEEVGLLGSYAYARELYDQQTPVLVEFNADMIGRATNAESGRKIRLSMTEDAGWIADVMKSITRDYGLNFNITAGWSINRDAKRGGSDYFNFIRLGYESLCVWQGEGDPYMHTPEDDINNVNISYLVNTTRHIAATIAMLADMEIEVPQVYIANPRYGKIFFNDNSLRIMKYKTPLVIDETNVYAEVTKGLYPIDRVEFYYRGRLLFTDKEKPFEYMLNKRSILPNRIKVVVYDTNGNSATDQMRIWFINLLKR